MTYKTFSFRNGIGSWDNANGVTLTLFGGIYNSRLPETFRKVKTIKLVEKASKPSQIKDGVWTIQADTTLMKKCEKMLDHEYYHQRPELNIKSKGRNIESIFAYMGCSPD